MFSCIYINTCKHVCNVTSHSGCYTVISGVWFCHISQRFLTAVTQTWAYLNPTSTSSSELTNQTSAAIRPATWQQNVCCRQACPQQDNFRCQFRAARDSSGKEAFRQPGPEAPGSLCAEKWSFHLSEWQEEEDTDMGRINTVWLLKSRETNTLPG